MLSCYHVLYSISIDHIYIIDLSITCSASIIHIKIFSNIFTIVNILLMNRGFTVA